MNITRSHILCALRGPGGSALLLTLALAAGACGKVASDPENATPLTSTLALDPGGPASFTVTGMTGGPDATVDGWLGDTAPTVTWVSSSGQADYEVTVVSSDGSTVVCAAQTAAGSDTSFSPSGCSLSDATAYKIRVVARSADGLLTAEASNSPYPFTVDMGAPTAALDSGPSNPTNATAASLAFSGADAASGLAGFQCSLDGGAYSACTSPRNLSGIAEGSHTFEVKSADAAGNVSSAAQYAWTVDTTPPGTFAVSGITGGSDSTADNLLANGSTAIVSWADTSNESEYRVTIYENDGSTVKCALVTKAADSTSHDFSSCALTGGLNYKADVRAADPVGNERVASNSPYSFTVAGPPPGGFSIAGLTGGSDSATDAWLGSTHPVIHWSDASGEASYEITIRNAADSADVCATESEPADATSHDFGTGCTLSNGVAYKAKAVAKNGQGIPSDASNSPYTFTIDLTAPGASISSGPSDPTNSTAAALVFGASDAGSGVAGLECSTDGGAYSSCTSPVNLSGLSEGAHSFDVRATDGAGNTSSAAHHAWTVDETAPDPFTIAGVTGGSDSTADNVLMNGLTPTLAWADSSGETEYRVTIYENDGSTVKCTLVTKAADATSHAFSSCTLTAGTHYKADVRARDAALNERIATNAPYDFRTADAAPTAFAMTGLTGGSDSTADAWLGLANPVVRWTDTSGETSYEVTIRDAANSADVCAMQTSAVNTSAKDMGVGCTLVTGTSYKAKVVAVNADGIATEATNSPFSFTVDLVAPTASITGGPADPTTSTSASLVFSASDAGSGLSGGLTCSVDSASYASCTSPLNLSGIADGAHSLTVRATDVAGNLTTSTAWSWTVDTTPPAAFAVNGITGGTDSTADTLLANGTNATVNWANTTGESEYRVTLYENDGTTVKCALATKAADVTSHAFSSCALTAGMTYKADVRARDALANERVATNSPYAFQVSGGAADHLAYSGPGAVASSDCVPYAVQSLSALNVPSPVGANTSVTLVINNGTSTNFYTTNACTTTTTSVTITSGNSSANVWLKSTLGSQSLTLVANSASLSSGTKAVSVGANATALWITGLGSTYVNDCQPYEVSRIDGSGNKIGDDVTTTINLSEDGNGVFYADSSCLGTPISQITVASYSQSTTIYAQYGAVETIHLTATDAAAGLTAGGKTVVVNPLKTWWNASWGRRIRVTVDNMDQATTHTNMPVLVQLTGMRIDYARTQNSGQDIRAVAADDTTQLVHQIEKWDESGTSYVWVRLPSITASSDATYFYLYYDNASAPDGQGGNSLWTNYWGVWHLGENPGATAPQYQDSTSGVRHGTAGNSPTRVTGPIGDALGVPGNDDAVDVGTGLSGVIGDTSTFQAWLKTNQAGNNTMWQAPGITGVESSGNGNDIFFGWLDAAGYIGVTAGDSTSAKSGFVVNDNAWRHVTITRSSSSGAIQFFVNGVLNGSGTSDTGVKSTAFSKFGIIGDTGGTPEDLNGSLDEIRIYNSVQTAARIKADYKYQCDTHLSYSAAETQ